jgi:hypothetical protein
MMKTDNIERLGQMEKANTMMKALQFRMYNWVGILCPKAAMARYVCQT